jgi:hypothetical protein
MFEAKTVADMTDYIEALVPVHPKVGTGSLAPTGEPYISFSIGGIVEELDRPDLIATKEPAACRWFLDSFLKYALDKRGTLYWREKPNLTTETMVPLSEYTRTPLSEDAKIYYVIWARLLMSDKPVLEEDE